MYLTISEQLMIALGHGATVWKTHTETMLFYAAWLKGDPEAELIASKFGYQIQRQGLFGTEWDVIKINKTVTKTP